MHDLPVCMADKVYTPYHCDDWPHYSFSMNDKINLIICVALLGTMTGCVGYVEQPRAVRYESAPPPPVQVVVQDDYVYYPRYEVYYSSSRHEYAYHEGNAWVSRPAPRGVSVNVLVASPSVKMDFHDAPANHHTTVVKQYPKNWKPAGNEQHPNDKHDDNKPGEHGDHDGK